MPEEYGVYYKVVEPKKLHPGMTPIIFLMHDNGSNEEEILERVAPYLDPYLRIISIRGPLTLEDGKYGWMNDDNPHNLTCSIHLLFDLYRDLLNKLYFDYCPILSQTFIYAEGAASHIVFNGFLTNNPYHGKVITVGANAYEELFLGKDESIRAKAYIVHGIHDDKVPVENGRILYEWFTENGLADIVQYHEFDMGHTPSDECLAELPKWIGRIHVCVV